MRKPALRVSPTLNHMEQNNSNEKRYCSYDSHMRRLFGGKVIKVPLDGGFLCPNIDGRKGTGGCRYCTKQGLSYRGLPLKEQFERGRLPLLKKWGRADRKEQYIAYFQVFTNTYAPAERLRALYEEAMALPDVVGISIATRADCLPEETVSLLRELDKRTYLTVELGLQTVHEETARAINRCHSYREFLDAAERLDGLKLCVHLINGLPGESEEMMLESARQVAAIRPYSVKLHMLYLEEGSAMTEEYRRQPFPMLTMEEYVSVTVSQLELLPPDTVIGRLTGDGHADRLVAPMWSTKKFAVLNAIDREFKRRNSFQGCRFEGRGAEKGK